MNFSVLMLNSGYEPLSIINWQKAIRLIYLKKAEVLESYKAEARSPSTSMRIPAVIRLLIYVNPRHTQLVFSKWNMYFRDGFRCQYCGRLCAPSEVTKDHIIPRCHGGNNDWENCVTSCKECNNKKGDRTPEEARMNLLSDPRKPKDNRVAFIVKRKGGSAPEIWMPYLPMLGKSQ